MRNKAFFFPFLMIALLGATLCACKKSDNTYYNYENNLKQFNGSAFDYLQSQPEIYDSLLTVLNRFPDLQDSLKNQNLTIFAVTNQSFKIAMENLNTVRKRANKPLISLSSINIDQLDTMICKYFIHEKLTTANFESYADGIFVNSIKFNYKMHLQFSKATASGFIGGGPSIITFTDPKNSIFVRYWQSTPTNAVNIKTNNAIVNVVSPGHDFGFGDFVTRSNK